ncbi:hypothetical protein ACK8OR_05360 [Jannaschia sp. KMU-145]|uniref:hypothetical protein n=1 Tax=Jannaschia halovivens TaxID=3388667 RepID=UPI00396AF985
MDKFAPDTAGDIAEWVALAIDRLPLEERAAGSLTVAARAVEMAAFEVARSGEHRQAPGLILMADRLLRLAEGAGADDSAA